MNTLGFFVCWIAIGVFVLLSLGNVVDKWQKEHYSDQDNQTIDSDIEESWKTVDDYRAIMGNGLVNLISAFCYLMVIVAWPIAVPAEFIHRRSVLKKYKKGES